MKLDSARQAKAEVMSKAFGFVEDDGVSAAGATVPSFVAPESIATLARRRDGPLGWERAPERLLAVGIERDPEGVGDRGDNDPQARLVIFGQRKRLRDHPIVEKALRIAHGNARFVFTGPISKAASHWSPERRRPLAPGCSIGHAKATAGTLGCFVDRGPRGGVCMLSNSHVLANSGHGERGDVILQPGRADGGAKPHDIAGTLYHFIPFVENGGINTVDCAIAIIGADVAIDPIACAPSTGRKAPALVGVSQVEALEEIEVVKVGRTTGVTFGRILATEVDKVEVNYGSAQYPRMLRFDNQITAYSDTAHFAKRGDSGSIVTSTDGEAIGMVFAVSERGAPGANAGITFLNPIDLVLRELDAQLWLGRA